MIKKKVLFGLGTILASSFSYGFYRSWTLPIWKQKPIQLVSWNDIRQVGFRGILSIYIGLIYMFPPTMLMKYYHLYLRIQDVKRGTNVMNKPDHWREFGFYHPKVF